MEGTLGRDLETARADIAGGKAMLTQHLWDVWMVYGWGAYARLRVAPYARIESDVMFLNIVDHSELMVDERRSLQAICAGLGINIEDYLVGSDLVLLNETERVGRYGHWQLLTLICNHLRVVFGCQRAGAFYDLVHFLGEDGSTEEIKYLMIAVLDGEYGFARDWRRVAIKLKLKLLLENQSSNYRLLSAPPE